MKRALKYGGNVVTVLLGLLLLVTVYAAVSSRVSGSNPRIFGLQWYEVLSGSMEPHLHVGSVIFDNSHVNANNLKVGDVITFHAPNDEYGSKELIITHRIHKVVHQNGQIEFQTKGDANNAPDPSLVPTSNVIAQYDNITIPYMGYYLNFMKTKAGIGLLLILPGILLLVSTLTSLFKEISKLSNAKKQESLTRSESDVKKI